MGLVASLNRPGGNATGVTNLNIELAPKRLQLLRQVIPNATRFGVLADPAFPNTQSTIADLQAAARTLGLQLVILNAGTDSDLEMVFAILSQQRVGAVVFGPSSFYSRRTEQLAVLAARHALPAIFPFRGSALAGGLMSYGSSNSYLTRQAGIYAGRILKMLWGGSGENISIAALSKPMEPCYDETQSQDCERPQPVSRPAGYRRDGDRGDRRSSGIMRTFLRG